MGEGIDFRGSFLPPSWLPSMILFLQIDPPKTLSRISFPSRVDEVIGLDIPLRLELYDTSRSILFGPWTPYKIYIYIYIMEKFYYNLINDQ